MKIIEQTITIPSNRIYFDELEIINALNLEKFQHIYTQAEEKLYNIYYDKDVLGHPHDAMKELKQWFETTYKLDPLAYYLTSLHSHANGMLASQKALQKQYIEDDKNRSENRKKKLASLRRNLTILRKAKDDCIKRSKTLKKKPKAKFNLKVPQTLRHKFKKEYFKDENAFYLYECYLDQQIRKTKQKVALIAEKERVSSNKERKIQRITFGSKHQYKLKDTVENIDMTQWHNDREAKRNHTMLFSGRFDAKYKNWLCKYDHINKTMNISLMDRTNLHLKNVVFPYRFDDLVKVLTHPKEAGYSVGYWLVTNIDHKGRKYFIIKASFTVRNEVDDFVDGGVVGLDINYDNISYSELDYNGCRVGGKMIEFQMEKNNSNKNTDTLGRAVSQVISYCKEHNKPLIIEDIDLSKKKAQLQYKNKKSNHHVSMFAYDKLKQLIFGKALREGVAVITVNPAYTSYIARVKYKRHMKSTVHEAASYTIGRRGMKIKDKLPKYIFAQLPTYIQKSNRFKQYAYAYKNKIA